MNLHQSPGARLKAALKAECVAIPGAFNALTAKMAERLGFAAAYFSGGALSAGWAGLPDIGLVTQTEFASEAAVVARATSLPILADADTGFGEPIQVERTLDLFERAGLAGLHIEDQEMPKRCGHLSGKSLVPIHTMAAKIRAAVAARVDPDFLLVARTDARTVEGFEGAVMRAQAYLDAGADAIFPEALESREEFAAFADRVPCLLIANMTEFGRGPLLDIRSLGQLGYRGVLFPLTAFRAAMQAAWNTLEQLNQAGTQAASVPSMMTRAKLYELIDYQDFDARDRRYFGPAAEGDASCSPSTS
jgi:methylisocitrate lyase